MRAISSASPRRPPRTGTGTRDSPADARSVAQDDGRQQVGAAVERCQRGPCAVSAVTSRAPGVAGRCRSARDPLRHSRVGEGRQRRLLVVGRARHDVRQPLGQRRRDRARRATPDPHAGGIHARPAAVLGDPRPRSGRRTPPASPAHVVADQDLAVARAVQLDARIAPEPPTAVTSPKNMLRPVRRTISPRRRGRSGNS